MQNSFFPQMLFTFVGTTKRFKYISQKQFILTEYNMERHDSALSKAIL